MLKYLGIGKVEWNDAWFNIQPVPFKALIEQKIYSQSVVQTNYGEIYHDENENLLVIIHNYVVQGDEHVEVYFTVVPCSLVVKLEIFEEVKKDA